MSELVERIAPDTESGSDRAASNIHDLLRDLDRELNHIDAAVQAPPRELDSYVAHPQGCLTTDRAIADLQEMKVEDKEREQALDYLRRSERTLAAAKQRALKAIDVWCAPVTAGQFVGVCAGLFELAEYDIQHRLDALSATQQRLEKYHKRHQAEIARRDRYFAECPKPESQQAREDMKDRLLRELQEKVEKGADAQWQQLNAEGRNNAGDLADRAAAARRDMESDIDGINAETLRQMMEIAQSSASAAFRESARTGAQRYRSGPSANCAQSRQKIAALENWIREARLSRASSGISNIDRTIAQVQREIQAERQAAARMGCR